MWEKIRNLLVRFKRIVRLSAKCHRSNLNSQRAVTLTYYTLFAVVPLVAMLFGITKGFNLENNLQAGVLDRFPSSKLMLERIFTFAATALEHASGGVIAGVGVLCLLWSGFVLADNVEMSFSSIWGLPRRRNFLHRFNCYFTVLFLMPILLIILSSASGMLHSTLEHLQETYCGIGNAGLLTNFFSVGSHIISRVLPLVVTCGIFFLIYFFAPNTKVRWKSALFAALFAGIVYQVVQDIFWIVQQKLFSYNHVYGSFAMLPIFLIWVQVAWKIVLYGAEVGFVTQNLHTGLFDLKTAASASPNLQLIQQLSVAKIIFRNVKENRGATAWGELERRLGLAEVEIDRIIAALINAGIIEQIKKNRSVWFLPVIPTDSSLVDCICRLRNVGRNAMPLEMKKECAALIAAIGELTEAEKRIAGDKILHQL